MSQVLALQRQRNIQTSDAWDSFAGHRGRVMHLIERCATVRSRDGSPATLKLFYRSQSPSDPTTTHSGARLECLGHKRDLDATLEMVAWNPCICTLRSLLSAHGIDLILNGGAKGTFDNGEPGARAA